MLISFVHIRAIKEKQLFMSKHATGSNHIKYTFDIQCTKFAINKDINRIKYQLQCSNEKMCD